MVLPFILYYSYLWTSNCLQKGKKLAKGVNKLVGKVTINLLRHTKSAISIMSKIIMHLLAMVSSYS